MRASNNGGGPVWWWRSGRWKSRRLGCMGMTSGWRGVCLCGEGMRGLESAEKAVSGRWDSRCVKGWGVGIGDWKARWLRCEGGGQKRQLKMGRWRGLELTINFNLGSNCNPLGDIFWLVVWLNLHFVKVTLALRIKDWRHQGAILGKLTGSLYEYPKQEMMYQLRGQGVKLGVEEKRLKRSLEVNWVEFDDGGNG